MPAKKGINLIPQKKKVVDLQEFLNWSVNVGRWIVVLTEFVVICAFLSRFYFDTKLANLFDELNEKKAIVNSAVAFEEDFRSLQNKLKIIKELYAASEQYSTIIRKIIQKVPSEVTFKRFSIEKNKITIEGSAYSERAVSLFVRSLVSDPDFQNIALKLGSSKEDINKIGFTINFEFKNK